MSTASVGEHADTSTFPPHPSLRLAFDGTDVAPLAIGVTTMPHGVRLAVVGEVDLATAPQLRSAVADAVAAGSRVIDLDLEQVSFIDSTGLAGLLQAREAAAPLAVVTVVEASRNVRRLLDLTGLATVLGVAIDAPRRR